MCEQFVALVYTDFNLVEVFSTRIFLTVFIKTINIVKTKIFAMFIGRHRIELIMPLRGDSDE